VPPAELVVTDEEAQAAWECYKNPAHYPDGVDITWKDISRAWLRAWQTVLGKRLTAPASTLAAIRAAVENLLHAGDNHLSPVSNRHFMAGVIHCLRAIDAVAAEPVIDWQARAEAAEAKIKQVTDNPKPKKLECARCHCDLHGKIYWHNDPSIYCATCGPYPGHPYAKVTRTVTLAEIDEVIDRSERLTKAAGGEAEAKQMQGIEGARLLRDLIAKGWRVGDRGFDGVLLSAAQPAPTPGADVLAVLEKLDKWAAAHGYPHSNEGKLDSSYHVRDKIAEMRRNLPTPGVTVEEIVAKAQSLHNNAKLASENPSGRPMASERQDAAKNIMGELLAWISSRQAAAKKEARQ
jgi:hypothetical protein